MQPLSEYVQRTNQKIDALDTRIQITKQIIAIVGVAGLLICIVGCAKSSAPPTTEEVLQWVPMRTPAASARQIMEQHRFVCSMISNEEYKKQYDGGPWNGVCINNVLEKDWDKPVEIQTNVSYLICKRGQVTVAFGFVDNDNETTGFGIRPLPPNF